MSDGWQSHLRPLLLLKVFCMILLAHNAVIAMIIDDGVFHCYHSFTSGFCVAISCTAPVYVLRRWHMHPTVHGDWVHRCTVLLSDLHAKCHLS